MGRGTKSAAPCFALIYSCFYDKLWDVKGRSKAERAKKRSSGTQHPQKNRDGLPIRAGRRPETAFARSER